MRDGPANIILAHCHDLGRFLNCYGVKTVHTPHLDAFADSGVRFDNAFCTAPQCSPSRAALFTGRYPHQTGVLGLTQPPFKWDMAAGERHLARLLGAAGYRTVLTGIHHESRTAPDSAVAAQLGFDIVETRGQRGADVTALTVRHLEDLVAHNQPFYLQAGWLEPHRLHNRAHPQAEVDHQGFLGDYLSPDDSLGVSIPPYLCDEPSAHVELAELQGAVRYLDEQVGALLQTVDRLGIAENAVVVFTTDHGLALPRAKCSLYDPGLETALIVRAPGHGWAGGRTVHDLVSNIDLTPTLLEAVGVTVPTTIEGESLVPLLAGHGDGRSRAEIFAEMTYHTSYDPRRCIRTRDHKLIANFSVAPDFMDCSSSWRPRTRPRRPDAMPPRNEPYGFHPPVEFYDLNADPLEHHNVVDQSPDLVGDLALRLRAWMDATHDPLLEGAVRAPMHSMAEAALADAASAVVRS